MISIHNTNLYNYYEALNYISEQINGQASNLSFVEAHLRIVVPPTVTLNVTTYLDVGSFKETYVKGTTRDAYPGTALTWKIEDRILLENSEDLNDF